MLAVEVDAIAVVKVWIKRQIVVDNAVPLLPYVTAHTHPKPLTVSCELDEIARLHLPQVRVAWGFERIELERQQPRIYEAADALRRSRFSLTFARADAVAVEAFGGVGHQTRTGPPLVWWNSLMASAN